jgi:peptidoglycan hydrolase-like amidase
MSWRKNAPQRGTRLPQRARAKVARLLSNLPLALGVTAASGVALATTVQAQTIQQGEPAVIRVAIRAYNNPWGPILWVQTVGFQDYCANVLPNEWFPSWSPQALQAGAMAVKMFGWYHTQHPVTVDGFTFDVDNTTNFQEYKFLSGLPSTDQAVAAIWPYAYVGAQGQVYELPYRSGLPNEANWEFAASGKMAQWGSQYLAQSGFSYLRILRFYYPPLQLVPASVRAPSRPL